MKFARNDSQSGDNHKDKTQQSGSAPCLKVLHLWDQHREYLLRNKLRIY
jgi:hypothetical protein